MNQTELLQKLAEDGIRNLWPIYYDYNARASTKTVPSARFESVVKGGVVFARANLDFAVNEHMPDDALWSADTGDFLAVPDPNACYKVPYLPDTAWAMVDMMTEDGQPFEGDPRGALKRMVAAYAEKGMTLTVALEAEFALYTKTDSGEYAPANNDSMFSAVGLNRHVELMYEIVHTLEAMGIPVEQMGKEYGPSQYEFTTRYNDPVTAVDQYLIAKDVVRALATKRGLIASYMPKTFDDIPGCGLHAHMALWDKDGNNLMLSPDVTASPLSTLGEYFVGGLLAHAPGLSGVGAPTVNSYKRLQPGSWAPAHITWGVGNRASLVRVPDTNERARAEYRVGDNTCNPYIYLTALLAAGLDGIDKQTSPGKPISDIDVGHMSADDMAAHDVRFLPRNLADALNAFENDATLTAALAPSIAQEYLKVKRLELDAYNLHVHPWERQMYLEVT